MKPGKPAEDIAGAIAARRSRLATRAAYGALLLRIAALLAAGYVFFTQLFLIVQVRGMDMFPALKDGDLAIVFRLQREYMQDDVIAYMAEDGLHFGRIVARAKAPRRAERSCILPMRWKGSNTHSACRKTACLCWAITAHRPLTAEPSAPSRWRMCRARCSPFCGGAGCSAVQMRESSFGPAGEDYIIEPGKEDPP